MLVPGKPEQQTQFIDVRDLAGWIVRMVEEGKTGVYNATGPDYSLSMKQFLEECKSASGSDTRFVWVDEAFLVDILEEVNFQPWVPEEYAGMRSANCNKAFAAGLTFRPLAATARDTLAWKAASASKHEMLSGLKAEQERELLQKRRSRYES